MVDILLESLSFIVVCVICAGIPRMLDCELDPLPTEVDGE